MTNRPLVIQRKDFWDASRLRTWVAEPRLGPDSPCLEPASTPASVLDSEDDFSVVKASRKTYKNKLFEETSGWKVVPTEEEFKQQMCYDDDDDDPETFSPRSHEKMYEEWKRREYDVIHHQVQKPQRLHIFGTAEWYDFDRLRCWTNFSCHWGGGWGKALWPEGYQPRFLEELKSYVPPDQESVFSDETGDDVASESVIGVHGTE
ncbi:hypothetical protein XANCAGTX0491_009992 [Xanthoria calcicola]